MTICACVHIFIAMKNASREDIFRLHARFCRAFGDAHRLFIIMELRDRPRTVNDLAKSIGASQSLTSRHLGVLREKGLVIAERDGAYVRYRIADRRIIAAIELLLDVLASQLELQAKRSSVARRLHARAS